MCVAIPARIVEVSEDRHFAVVEVSGVRRTINVDLLAADGGASPDDWVLVHAGFAMSRIRPDEAAAQIEFLESMGDWNEARGEFGAYPGGEEA